MTRDILVRGVAVIVLSILRLEPAVPAEEFPFDQEFLLDAAPMRPGKRMPILLVEPNGNAKIDLWCKSVPARENLRHDHENRARPVAGRRAGNAECGAMHA